MTKALDTSRPVIGNDGWEYSSGDLWTLHLYYDAQRSLDDRLAALLADPSQPVTEGDRPRNGALPGSDPSQLPVMLTECGGVGFDAGDHTREAFAYGDLPTDAATLEQNRARSWPASRPAQPRQGFVWTQFTDVQQEIIDFYTLTADLSCRCRHYGAFSPSETGQGGWRGYVIAGVAVIRIAARRGRQ